MAEFSLPAPWGAPEAELVCVPCGRTTAHYERRLTLMADEPSDRLAGQVAWFCVTCGHKHAARTDPEAPSTSEDDDSQMFDRH
jgi:hypothetical protein